tara:strand:+ start:435 stop:1109 length:675 start_codon:yes stop_codon:yes gene_type:complete
MFAYIPARSGSKRIKNKNIKLLMGRPIISWVIEKIKEAELVEDIYVSTDDEAIAEISIKYGAKVLKLRDKNLSKDETTFGDLLLNDIPYYAKQSNSKDCLFVLSTAAMIRKNTLRKAYNEYISSESEILMSTKLINAYWALKENGEYLNALFPEFASLNSQQLPKTYIDAGLFYFFNVHSMVKYSDFNLAKKIKSFLVDDNDGFDINTIDEWNMLELKFKEDNN